MRDNIEHNDVLTPSSDYVPSTDCDIQPTYRNRMSEIALSLDEEILSRFDEPNAYNFCAEFGDKHNWRDWDRQPWSDSWRDSHRPPS